MTTPSQFYYPIKMHYFNGTTSDTYAPLVVTLPLMQSIVDEAVILALDVGDTTQGLYVFNGARWNYALPMTAVSESIVRANSIDLYVNSQTTVTLPSTVVVYKNGQLQGTDIITAGPAVYAVLIPITTGGGGGAVDSVNGKTGAVVISASGGVTVNNAGSVIALTLSLTNQLVVAALGFTPYDASNPANYLSSITSGNVITALGYTPYNATNPANYLSSITSSNVITALGYTPYNASNPANYLSSITSSNVITALGFTPYNATNPNNYIAGNQAITVSGDATGTGTTAIALILANSGVTAGTYTKVTVDGKGRVTVGTNPTTLAGYNITDALSNTGGSVSGTITLTGGAKIAGSAAPANPGDLTNKTYVDNAIAAVANGTQWRANVQAATTAAVTLAGLSMVDSYQTTAGDRVLVKNQVDGTQNGIYVVALGSWARANDSDIGDEIQGSAVLSLMGTVNGLMQFVNTNASTITIGTTPITYAQLQGSGSIYTAGTGLTLTSMQFSITPTGVTAGTFTKVTVNAQGQVTTGALLASADVTTALGYTPYNSTNPSNYLTANQSITLSGAVSGTGSTAIVTVLADSGVTAGTFTKVTVNAKGVVTTGALLASADITTALTYTPVNKAGDTLTGALNFAAPVTLASAATVNIGAAASNNVTITGAVTITAFDTIAAGAIRKLTFSGAATLTNNATSLILLTGANITTAAGDVAQFSSLGAGNWRCDYYSKAGAPVTYATLTGVETLTNKTLTNAVITGYIESGTIASGTAFSPDFTTGTDYEYTTTGNITITLPAASVGRSGTISIIYGGVHTVTFVGGTAIKYPNGNVAPVATSVAGKMDIYVIKSTRAATATVVADGGRNI